MTTWHKRDWKQFYELARRPWQRHRPPRPIYPTGINRVLPAAGFSLSELDDAGLDLDLAESLGLPVDAGRIALTAPTLRPCEILSAPPASPFELQRLLALSRLRV
jgi:ribosomal protein L13E